MPTFRTRTTKLLNSKAYFCHEKEKKNSGHVDQSCFQNFGLPVFTAESWGS